MSEKDVPHPFALLRVRRQRPHCRTADETNRLAPLHVRAHQK
jgi:hypothetical protein